MDSTDFFSNRVIRTGSGGTSAPAGGLTNGVEAQCEPGEQVVGGRGRAADPTKLDLTVSYPVEATPPRPDDDPGDA